MLIIEIEGTFFFQNEYLSQQFRVIGSWLLRTKAEMLKASRCHSEPSERGATFAPRLLLRGERSGGIPPSCVMQSSGYSTLNSRSSFCQYFPRLDLSRRQMRHEGGIRRQKIVLPQFFRQRPDRFLKASRCNLVPADVRGKKPYLARL